LPKPFKDPAPPRIAALGGAAKPRPKSHITLTVATLSTRKKSKFVL